MAFMYLSFPNNKLKNIPLRIVYAEKGQLFIITSGVSAKVCARHYSPGKLPSQFARTLLFGAGSEAWVQRNTCSFFLASVKFRAKEQTHNRTKDIGNHSTSSPALFLVKRISKGCPAVKPLPVIREQDGCNLFTILLSWLIKLKVMSQIPPRTSWNLSISAYPCDSNDLPLEGTSVRYL